MKINKILLDNNIKSINKTTIIKLCLSKDNILGCLENFSIMKNNGTKEFEDYYQSFCNNREYVDFSGKYNFKLKIYNNLFRANTFCYIDNWNSDFLNSITVLGPYISGDIIYFYIYKSNLLAAFDYFPFENLKSQQPLSDILVREINFYVFDNVSEEIFYEIFSKNPEENIDYKAIECYRTLTTRYSSVPNEIVKILNYNNYFHWQFITIPDRSHISDN